MTFNAVMTVILCVISGFTGGGSVQPRYMTPSMGAKPEWKKIVAEFTRNSGQRRSDTEKWSGVTPSGGGGMTPE